MGSIVGAELPLYNLPKVWPEGEAYDPISIFRQEIVSWLESSEHSSIDEELLNILAIRLAYCVCEIERGYHFPHSFRRDMFFNALETGIDPFPCQSKLTIDERLKLDPAKD